jgi:protein-disulfide isomerase
LKQYAANIGLDTEAFNTCLDSGQFKDDVAQDFADGQRFGVRGTPAFFINGRFLSGNQPFENLAKIIDEELEAKGVATR